MYQEKEKPVGFHDFHLRTSARFTPCATPAREPDFVSPSGSAYWDEGDAVIRASDHWAGHSGCTGQASCIWSLDCDELDPGQWATGRAPYAGFRRIRAERPVPGPGAQDQTHLALLRAAGGAMSLEDWAAASGHAPIPLWARRVFPGPELIPDCAKALFRARPELRAAIAVDDALLRRMV